MDIRDIAKHAKVSIATVSRTINHVSTVDPDLAKRVWKAIDELGYYPNTQARTLVSGKSRIFGLVIPDITNPFFPGIVQAFEEIAIQYDYEILLTSTGNDQHRMEKAIRRMIERQVDGVAIMTFGMEEELLEHLHFRKMPLVFIDVGPPLPLVSNIRIQYQIGVRQAVQHLASHHHRRIAFVSGPPELKSATARTLAFQNAMAEKGLEVPDGMIVSGHHTVEGGLAAFEQLAARTERPTAVMCSNDVSAIGVMRKAYELGIQVPDDLSVIGFDDIHLAEFVIPPLTSIRMSQTELARLAFHALLADVERTSLPPAGTEYFLTTELVLRKSTAPVRKPAAEPSKTHPF
ncbi:LacI family DNA-binding transcriptional regulator [Telmatospirillum siberiense]|uniref:LacI family transcriptional regulator n=1 Tax=Telmatospirillum siberiense TaxID=382514 RepID=A0A2N3PZV8_9PROT|nr:LacI family DNA-binding transcriptional regulator [Telmatospirillum siberiense]PKU25929.1 LacI family transcriptional regulator [Telmatospirillum siberiense]